MDRDQTCNTTRAMAVAIAVFREGRKRSRKPPRWTSTHELRNHGEAGNLKNSLDIITAPDGRVHTVAQDCTAESDAKSDDDSEGEATNASRGQGAVRQLGKIDDVDLACFNCFRHLRPLMLFLQLVGHPLNRLHLLREPRLFGLGARC